MSETNRLDRDTEKNKSDILTQAIEVDDPG